jgi:hypothetical protein
MSIKTLENELDNIKKFSLEAENCKILYDFSYEKGIKVEIYVDFGYGKLGD